MPNFIQQLNDKTVCATISGVLGAEDLEAIQNAARDAMARVGKINAMFILQDFAGFAKGVDWGNMEFYAEHGNDIVKMAIVGDPAWKDHAFVFVGAGIRKTTVKFFAKSEFGQAHAWITSEG